MGCRGVAGNAGPFEAQTLQHGQELDDTFAGLEDPNTGRMSVAGFGSLLSIRSAQSTFPMLENFRVRRGEIASLSCEEAEGESIVVAVFDLPYIQESVQAFIDREDEFRFLAVQHKPLDPAEPPAEEPLAVICVRWDDEGYRARRCPPQEFQRRFADYGVHRIWRDDILPCRTYLRHCALAAQGLGKSAEDSFLDHTYLGDRKTTMRTYLGANPDVMTELPPLSLAERYGG